MGMILAVAFNVVLPFMLALAILVSLQGCVDRQDHYSRRISMRDIDRLSDHAALADVVELVGETTLLGFPVFFCPAIDGGLYVFTFAPTNEVADVKADSENGVLLYAIVHCDSSEAFVRRKGRYVWPRVLLGKRFAGFPPPP